MDIDGCQVDSVKVVNVASLSVDAALRRSGEREALTEGQAIVPFLEKLLSVLEEVLEDVGGFGRY